MNVTEPRRRVKSLWLAELCEMWCSVRFHCFTSADDQRRLGTACRQPPQISISINIYLTKWILFYINVIKPKKTEVWEHLQRPDCGNSLWDIKQMPLLAFKTLGRGKPSMIGSFLKRLPGCFTWKENCFEWSWAKVKYL